MDDKGGHCSLLFKRIGTTPLEYENTKHLVYRECYLIYYMTKQSQYSVHNYRWIVKTKRKSLQKQIGVLSSCHSEKCGGYAHCLRACTKFSSQSYLKYTYICISKRNGKQLLPGQTWASFLSMNEYGIGQQQQTLHVYYVLPLVETLPRLRSKPDSVALLSFYQNWMYGIVHCS